MFTCYPSTSLPWCPSPALTATACAEGEGIRCVCAYLPHTDICETRHVCAPPRVLRRCALPVDTLAFAPRQDFDVSVRHHPLEADDNFVVHIDTGRLDGVAAGTATPRDSGRDRTAAGRHALDQLDQAQLDRDFLDSPAIACLASEPSAVRRQALKALLATSVHQQTLTDVHLVPHLKPMRTHGELRAKWFAHRVAPPAGFEGSDTVHGPFSLLLCFPPNLDRFIVRPYVFTKGPPYVTGRGGPFEILAARAEGFRGSALFSVQPELSDFRELLDSQNTRLRLGRQARAQASFADPIRWVREARASCPPCRAGQ